MRIISLTIAAVTTAATFAISAQASEPATGGTPTVPTARHICISTREIVNEKVENGGASILYKMRDGTQWRNTLQGKCPDLIFEGYVWNVRNPDYTVCEYEQSFHVLRSGETCTLGKFDKVTPPPPKAG